MVFVIERHEANQLRIGILSISKNSLEHTHVLEFIKLQDSRDRYEDLTIARLEKIKTTKSSGWELLTPPTFFEI